MQQSDEPEFDLLERQQIFQRVMRVWHPYLSMAERLLVIHIVDNTISWGRSTIRVKLDHLVYGNGAMSPCGLSRASLYRTLKRLRDRGIVMATSNGRASTITLNLHWTPAEPMLPTPKRLRKAQPERPSTFVSRGFSDDSMYDTSPQPEVSNRDSRSLTVRHQKSHDETADVSNWDPHKKDSSLQDSSPQPTVAATATAIPGNTARAAIAKVTADRKARRTAERDTRSAWVDAWVAAFPSIPCPPWGREDVAMMAKLQERSAMAEPEWLDFVTWVVGNWPEIRVVEFAWMTKRAAPSRPVPRFVVKFAPKLFDLFASWSTDRRLSLATGDAAEIERLMGAGMSQQQALIELGKRKGVAEQREALERERKEAALLTRAAQRHTTQAPPRVHKPLPEVRYVHGTNPYETGYTPPDPAAPLQWGDES